MTKWLLVLLSLIGMASLAFADEPGRVVLPNGMRVIVRPDPGTDIVAVDLLFDISVLDEPAGQAGIRYLIQSILLSEPSGSGGTPSRRLAKVGGAMDVSVGLDYLEIYALVPADGFELAVRTLADTVRNPAFGPEQIERQKRFAMQAAAAAQEEPFQATYLAMRRLLYGDHPYARSTFGERESLAAITPDDLITFHKRYYDPGRAVLAVCGGVDPAQVSRAVRAAFGDWAGEGAAARGRPHPPVPPLTASEGAVRELATQRAQLIIGFLAPAATEPGYYEMQLIDSLLTGRYSSRLPKLIREQLGLAYDVSSFCPTLAGPSHFAVYVVTEPYSVDAVKTALLGEISRLTRQPVSEEELARAKRFLLGSYTLSHQRMRDQAYALAWYEVLNLGLDFDRRYAEAIQAVTPSQVQATAGSVLSTFALAVTMPAE